MDENFHQNGLPTLSGSQPQIAPHQGLPPQRFPGQPGHANTLPPLNGIQQQFSPMYGQSNSTPQTPLTPHTPSTTAPSSHATPIPSISAHPPPQMRSVQPSPSNYMYSGPQYTQSQPSLLPTTTAQSNPQPIAPAPLSNPLHDLRPMPQGGLGLPSQYGQGQLYSQQPILPNQEPEPIHVVGQQGRRGVLPTVPGRPAPGTAKSLTNPTKNSENKFECPHCNKTYLHLKHLKRHTLRHTGERPYQCHLCKDTFSRSDILKRHFQKCSLRRGNPTGAGHLSHQNSHLKKNRMSTGSISEHHYLSGINTSSAYTDGNYASAMSSLPGMPPEQTTYAESLPPLSARTSRSNSLIQSANMNENRRSMSSLDFLRSGANLDGHDFRTMTSMSGTFGQGLPAFSTPPSNAIQMTQNNGYNPPTSAAGDLYHQLGMKSEDMNPPLYGRNGLANLEGTQNGHDDTMWGNTFPTEGADGLIGIASTMGSGLHSIKAEADIPSNSLQTSDTAPDGMFTALYSNPSVYAHGDQVFDNWDLSSSDPWQTKTNALIAFCFPNGATSPNELRNLDELKKWLTVDNIKHFWALFRNFQGHWPMIHLPTFNFLETNNGLLLVIICIGAVYDETKNIEQVRWLMEVVKQAIQRSSRVLRIVETSTQNDTTPIDPKPGDIEEIQALFLLQALFIWNGTQTQRQAGRDEFWKLAAIIRRSGFLQAIPPGRSGYSILHQRGGNPAPQELSTWRWESWVEQEKRLRVVYPIYLLDAALTMFFNCPSYLDCSEIRLPLPADDGAWEAKNAADCATALGINGVTAQERLNVTGSRRLKQIDMNSAMRFLFQHPQDFKARNTNVYSKFILIHALVAQLISWQRQAAQPGGMSGFAGFPSSGASTPQSHNDWVAGDGSNGTPSATNSGAATPTENFGGQTLPPWHHTVSKALEKWKRSWEMDMELQYPVAQPDRRVGFCRDGIHFYHLASTFLRNNRSMDLFLPADKRMQQVFSVLHKIRRHVASDQHNRGQDIGSVTEVASDFGMEDITLNMRKLFTPLKAHSRQGSLSTNVI